jgi:hypothetical protein
LDSLQGAKKEPGIRAASLGTKQRVEPSEQDSNREYRKDSLAQPKDAFARFRVFQPLGSAHPSFLSSLSSEEIQHAHRPVG